MLFIGSQKRKQEICKRVKQIRYEKSGQTRGAQKEMAKALGIPYTTYRGYEENRINGDFLIEFARKFDVPLLWLLGADSGETTKKKASDPTVFVNPEKAIISSSKYKISRMSDDSMEPTILKGAWIGFLPITPDEDLHRKIVVLKESPEKIIARRLVVRDNMMIAIADNPHLSKDAVKVHKKDILGEVVWQFSKI